jgi:processing peptidase subunit alpha
MQKSDKMLCMQQENYTADRVVLAASGVDHEQLLNYAEFLLCDWHKGSPVEKPKSTYVGGDSRHRADSDVILSLCSTSMY